MKLRNKGEGEIHPSLQASVLQMQVMLCAQSHDIFIRAGS